MKLARLALAALSALVLSAPTQSQVLAQAPDARFDLLVGRAHQQGSARVILELRTQSARGSVQQRMDSIRAAQDQALGDASLRSLRPMHRYRHVPYIAAEMDAAALRAAKMNPAVLAVHEDALLAPSLIDSAPLVGAAAAWVLPSPGPYTGFGQNVAILDTGVDRTHPLLQQPAAFTSKVVYEACFSSTYPPYSVFTACPNGQDTQINVVGAAAPCGAFPCYHGTHVAGIAAGNGDNASPPQAFSGIAKDANIIAVQVFSVVANSSICGSAGTPCVLAFTSDIMRALDHVNSISSSYAIAAVNLSLGGGQFGTACDGDPIKPSIDLLRAAGIATVIASGNDGFTNSMSSPGCISSAVSVGATSKQDAVAGFSNSASMLNLLAPGVSINSAIPQRYGISYSPLSGTSMATPHVAGAFALLKSKSPGATVTQLLGALTSAGVPTTDPRNGIVKPRIQVDAALGTLAATGPALAVTPSDGLFATGPQAGPFTPSSRVYTLTNTGTGPLNLGVNLIIPWASVTLDSAGPLAAGASTIATVSIAGNAAALSQGTYGGAVNFTNTNNGHGNTSRALGLTVTAPLPQNDKFQNAIPLTSSGSLFATNMGATKDPGEPNHAGNPGGRSVWWRWTAPSTGQVTFDTQSSSFDTVLAAYTGLAVNALTQVAADDNALGAQSRISFPTTAGTTYQIAVDGAGGASGQIRLNWSFLQDIVQPGDIVVSPSGGFAPSGHTGGPFSPASIDYALANTSFGTRTYSVSSLPSWLTASPGSGSINAGQTAIVTLTVNTAVANLLPEGEYGGTVLFNGMGRKVTLTVIGSGGNNNQLIDAIPLNSNTVTVKGSNVGADKQPNEPDHAGVAGGASVWWRWTAPSSPASQIVTIDTFGSGFDTLLGVYTGASMDSLVQVAANDDDAATLQSRATFQATGGTEYRIAVDGSGGATGPITLRIASLNVGAPSNDLVATATVLSGSPASATGTNAGATKEPGEAGHAGNVGGASVWWKWTAPATQFVYVDTFGSSFNTLLGVYAGSSMTPIASNDDFGGPQSRLSFQAIQGTDYFIAVDGFNAGSGAAVGTIALHLGTTQPSPVGTSSLQFFSQPGDYIGQAQTGLIIAGQPNATFAVQRNFQQGVNLTIGNGVDLWSLSFAGVESAPLAPGVYVNAVRYPFNNGLSPGLEVSGNGRGCNQVTGSFEVFEAVYASNGDVVRFAANYVQHCEGGVAAMFGQVRIGSAIPLDAEPALPAPFVFDPVDNAQRAQLVKSNAATMKDIATAPVSIVGGEYSIDGGPFTGVPGTIGNGQSLVLRLLSPSSTGTSAFATVRVGAASATFQVTTAIGPGANALFFTSDPGDYIGQGSQRVLYAASGYTLTPTRNFHNGTTFNIKGNGQTWTLNFAAAGGASAPALAPDAYEGAVRFPFEAGAQPGMSLAGDARACNAVTGRFDVLDVAYGAGGEVNTFVANFEQHCEGLVPGLYGRIRYNSSAPLLNVPANTRDYDGNGKSDVFWKHTNTQTYVWQMNGAAIANAGSPASTGDSNWQVAGFGDFDGDGKSDVLFRHAVSGATFLWLMNGTSVLGTGSPGTIADLGWQVQGVGDFNGDGKADILWMHTNGTVQIWFMNGTTATSKPTVTALGAASGWVVQGVGDFNGDGKSDILWKHTSGTVVIWMMNGAAIASAPSVTNVGPDSPTAWQVKGVGDFNGDGKADILWRNDDIGGVMYIWIMNGSTIASATNVTGVGTEAATGWIVKSVGDYNGDGRADIFWKNDILPGNQGITYVWLMGPSGTSISTATSVTGVADTGWQVQNPK